MGTRQGILVVVECDAAGEPTNGSLEMLGAAVTLGQGLGWEIAAAAVAPDGAAGDRYLAERGIRRVFQIWPGDAGVAADVVYLEGAWSAVQETAPAAVFFTDSRLGQEIAARIAARLGCEAVAGCTLVKVQQGEVRFGRPCLSGKAQVLLQWNPEQPVVVTVAAGVFAPPARTAGSAEVQTLAVRAERASGQVTHIREVAPTPEGLDITEAEVLVAGGAGVGGPEGFALLTELARKLGGTVAASRVAVDRGWAPQQRQVGQTGRSVAPKVYLAFGISGAPQHIAGIRAAGKVIAVNRDPRAPIFEVADLAVVADLQEVVPVLLERLAGRAEAVTVGGR